MKSRVLIILIFAFIFSFSCLKKTTDIIILLPETKNPELMYQWAYIKEDMIPKLREAPDSEAKIVSYLHEGKLVKILKKNINLSELDNEYDYWYFVDYEGEHGWIFGTYIVIFNSKEETIKACEEMLLKKSEKIKQIEAGEDEKKEVKK